MNRNDNEMRRSEGDTTEKLPAHALSQPSMPQQVDKSPPKKKRKSPAVPWKKPKDMPKRPLSAYNLFFKAEREKLMAKLSAGPGKGKTAEEEETMEEHDEEDSAVITETVEPPDSPTKRHMKTSGLGFANLAKTIASKWKALDPQERAPYEERASSDKQRYDVEVSKWRVKQKAEQSLKKEAKEETPPKEAPRDAASSSFTLSPGIADALNAVEPYPAEWFDVVGSSSGTTAADPARPFEGSHTTFESSQQSLDQSGPHSAQHDFSAIRFAGHGGYIAGVPFPTEQGVQQQSLQQWSAMEYRRAEEQPRPLPMAINLPQNFPQGREMLAPHEFAQALSGEQSNSRLSPQFRQLQPPSPPLRYLDRDDQRLMESLSWNVAGGWGQQGNLSGFTLPPSQSNLQQFDPLPFEAPSTSHQLLSFNRSQSFLPQHPDANYQQFTGNLPDAGGRRFTWSVNEAPRFRHPVSSLEPMPQLYRPDLVPPPSQLDPSIIHNNQVLLASQQLASATSAQESKQETARVSDSGGGFPTSLGTLSSGDQRQQQQQQQQSTSFQEISQRLDDETIDFITGLPFP